MRSLGEDREAWWHGTGWTDEDERWFRDYAADREPALDADPRVVERPDTDVEVQRERLRRAISTSRPRVADPDAEEPVERTRGGSRRSERAAQQAVRALIGGFLAVIALALLFGLLVGPFQADPRMVINDEPGCVGNDRLLSVEELQTTSWWEEC